MPLLLAWLVLASIAQGRRLEPTFSGGLMRVTDGSISVRLADGRIIAVRNRARHGELSPRALAERYTVGDQVQITCREISDWFYPPINQPLSLELRKLVPLGKASGERLAKELESPEWRWTPNLLPTPKQQAANGDGAVYRVSERLARLRSRMLEFTARMPNFVADESVKRYVSEANPPVWRLEDTITSEVTFHGSLESRERILLNSEPWTTAYFALPGFKWTGAFGSILHDVFDPACLATFDPLGPAIEEHRSVSVIRFSSPVDACEQFFHGSQRFYPATSGRIVLDEREENVIRMEQNSVFPKEFPIAASEKKVSWDNVTIGGVVHLLPVSAEAKVVYRTGLARLSRNEYKNHRHFEAAAVVTFH